MPRHPCATLDVFTDTRFGGNPLAVVLDADALSDAQMQSVAAEFGYSETTFVLRPADPANTARVRIFTPHAELPFAGHPNVGTGFLLALTHPGDHLRFEEIAGLVEVEVARDASGAVRACTIDAPRPLALGRTLPAELAAACAGLPASSLRGAPVVAGVGLDFTIAEVAPDALARAHPVAAPFEALVAAGGSTGLLLHAGTGPRLAMRMFAPLHGIAEDPATGSAAAALVALLLSRTDAPRLDVEIAQGAEIGRPSQIRAEARREPDGIRARVGGACVQVLRGTIEV